MRPCRQGKFNAKNAKSKVWKREKRLIPPKSFWWIDLPISLCHLNRQTQTLEIFLPKKKQIHIYICMYISPVIIPNYRSHEFYKEHSYFSREQTQSAEHSTYTHVGKKMAKSPKSCSYHPCWVASLASEGSFLGSDWRCRSACRGGQRRMDLAPTRAPRPSAGGRAWPRWSWKLSPRRTSCGKLRFLSHWLA